VKRRREGERGRREEGGRGRRRVLTVRVPGGVEVVVLGEVC
jgi:hypothetical protein